MELGPLQKAWVEALRSGKYEQGKARLRNGDHYCCLGVACEVLGVQAEKLDNGSYTYDKAIGVLPRSVQDRLKIESCQGTLFNGKAFVYLTTINDRGVSFDEIADMIEKYADTLFKEPA